MRILFSRSVVMFSIRPRSWASGGGRGGGGGGRLSPSVWCGGRWRRVDGMARCARVDGAGEEGERTHDELPAERGRGAAEVLRGGPYSGALRGAPPSAEPATLGSLSVAAAATRRALSLPTTVYAECTWGVDAAAVMLRLPPAAARRPSIRRIGDVLRARHA